MALIVDTKEYLSTICVLLQEGKTDLPVPVTGSSMCPFLHPGDIVYLNRLDGAPKRGDIVLFTRAEGSFVLHRVFRARQDGSFLLLGDNQTQPEPVPGTDRIHALVTSARRRDKPLSRRSLCWWFYAHVWLLIRPLRSLIARLRH